MNDIFGTVTLIAKPDLAREFGISSRTLSRWLNDVTVKFPQPVVIRGRNYFARIDVEAWKSSHLRTALKVAAA